MMVYYNSKFMRRLFSWAWRRYTKANSNGKSISEMYDAFSKESKMYSTLAETEKAADYALAAYYLVKESQHTLWAETRLNVANCFLDLVEENNTFGMEALLLAFEVADDLESKAVCDRDWELLHSAYYFLGSVFALTGSFDEAYEYAAKGLDIAHLQLPNLPGTEIDSLEQIAYINSLDGRKERAWEYIKQEVALVQNTPSCDIWKTIEAYERLIFLGTIFGEEEVTDYFGRYLKSLARKPEYILTLPQERLRLSYLRDMRIEIDLSLSVAFQHRDAISAEDFYSFLLQATNVEAEINHIHTIFFNNCVDTSVLKQKQDVDSLRALVARMQNDGGYGEQEITEALVELNQAENDLAILLSQQKIPNPFSGISTESVQAALGNSEVLIEYGTFARIEALTGKQSSYQSYYYAVAVTKANIQLELLETCEVIDRMIANFRKDICSLEQNRADRSLTASLYQLLLAPFTDLLRGKDTVWVVPDKDLYTLPFELLEDKNGAALYETVDSITYLSSGRDLVKDARQSIQSSGITIMADPQFDLGSGTAAPKINRAPTDPMVRNTDRAVYPELPYTAVEAERISRYFSEKATLITKEAATVDAFFQKHSGDILHISTHGDVRPTARLNFSADETKSHIFGLSKNDMLADPLSQCGLILAGRNNWLRGEALSQVFGNGILTGSDILASDLSQYDLVVLAACQTGLGEIQSGEGVKGLRKAFSLAGAGVMVTTLWNVPDFVSAVFMDYFYALLTGDTAITVSEALLQTKEYLRSVSTNTLAANGWGEHIIRLFDSTDDSERFLGQRFKESPQPLAHPLLWAGFVLHGR